MRRHWHRLPTASGAVSFTYTDEVGSLRNGAFGQAQPSLHGRFMQNDRGSTSGVAVTLCMKAAVLACSTVMSANPPRQRQSVGGQEPTRRSDVGEARLWHIGTALTLSFTVAVLGLTGLAWLAWVLVGSAGFRRRGTLSLHDTIGVLQLVFASVAGAGALVALVVAYRRQKVAEATAALDKERWQATAAHDRTRLLNERFTAIAAQLGDDQPAVRLAGVHAMAGLTDDWEENRQTCIDVLCAYLRMPYEPDPGE